MKISGLELLIFDNFKISDSIPVLLIDLFIFSGASLVVQTVKNLPAVKETRVQSLDQEDPLEKEMAHSTILAWRIPWTEEPGGLLSMGLQRDGYYFF